MSKLIDDVREQASRVAAARTDQAADAECELLRRLGTAMKVEQSSFDAAHGFARILNATDAHGEVRLTESGEWTMGDAGEGLTATWSRPGHPALDEILDGIQKAFSSAKIGDLIDEIRPLIRRT